MSAADLTLVADVGGTNTRAALAEAGRVLPRSVRRLANDDFDSLDAALGAYMGDAGVARCDAACAAIAGPVRHGVGRLTNRDWSMDGERLSAVAGGGRAFVINDLEAQGHALDEVQTRPLLDCRADAGGEVTPRLVVGVGTGFNAAPVHGSGEALSVVPSECGHISLPVWDRTTFDLGLAIASEHDFASVEEALSGRGLRRLWGHFARDGDGDGARVGLASTDAIIGAQPGSPGQPEREAASLFCQLLGRVLGDLALVHLPWGGIFLIGGMARAVSPFALDFGFAEAFRHKGRFSTFLDNFPVHLVEDDFAALVGCARYASRQRGLG